MELANRPSQAAQRKGLAELDKMMSRAFPIDSKKVNFPLGREQRYTR